METKKNAKKDVRTKHTLFFQIGMTFSIGISLLAFSWQHTLYEDIIQRDTIGADIMEFLPPLPKHKVEEQKHQEDQKPPRNSQNFVAGEQTDTFTIISDTFGPPDPPRFDTIIIPRETLDVVEIFEVVEVMPAFPGGYEALDKYVKFNFNMPEEAARIGVSGKIFIEFVINEQGKMSDIIILTDDAGWGCSEEALRVIHKMANEITWKPGEQRNKKVKVRYRYPLYINAK